MAPVRASINRRAGHWLRALFLWALLLAVAVGQVPGAAAQAAPTPEYKLKAVFLYQFTQFVEWPRSTFAQPQAPLVIGILGDNPFGAYLEEVVRGEAVKGHPLVVRHYGRAEDVAHCHILFVSPSEADRLAQILPRLEEQPVLTVGDAGDFTRIGGIVQFVTEGGKIRLRINVDAAREAGVTISSKLLSLAEIVKSPGA